MAAKLDCVKVDTQRVRATLKRLNISTVVLAGLCGYADRASINFYLRRGELPTDVVEYLADKFNLDLTK